MRRVRIKFTDITALKYHLDKNELVHGCQIIIYNRRTQRLNLLNPRLTRSLVGGVVIIDQWGHSDKWFSDTEAHAQPLGL